MGTLLYKLSQDNREGSTTHGKWFARSVATKTLNFREFINHIIEHGSNFDRGTVTGVMTQMLDCMKELLLDSKRIQMGDLGTFYLSLKGKGADTVGEFNPQQHITAVRMRFLPNRKEGNDSQSMRKLVTFKSAKDLVSYTEMQAREAAKAAQDDTDDGDGTDDGNVEP